jgi:hypothetical protein
MRYLDAVRVFEFVNQGSGKAGFLRFHPDWEWCTSPEFRQLLLGPPAGVTIPEPCEPSEAVTPEGVCTEPTPTNLAEHQIEREEEKWTLHTGPEK